jgi:hypothetical protein
MKEKKWYQKWGSWLAIQLIILLIFSVLTNWIDAASQIGGFMLVCITIPYLIIMATVQTIKKVRENKNTL